MFDRDCFSISVNLSVDASGATVGTYIIVAEGEYVMTLEFCLTTTATTRRRVDFVEV